MLTSFHLYPPAATANELQSDRLFEYLVVLRCWAIQLRLPPISLSTDPSIPDLDTSCTCSRYCVIHGKLRPRMAWNRSASTPSDCPKVAYWAESQPYCYSSLRNIIPVPNSLIF